MGENSAREQMEARPDGSSVKFHEVAHFTMTKNGVIVNFDKAKCA